MGRLSLVAVKAFCSTIPISLNFQLEPKGRRPSITAESTAPGPRYARSPFARIEAVRAPAKQQTHSRWNMHSAAKPKETVLSGDGEKRRIIQSRADSPCDEQMRGAKRVAIRVPLR
jgi:hypothetical protein